MKGIVLCYDASLKLYELYLVEIFVRYCIWVNMEDSFSAFVSGIVSSFLVSLFFTLAKWRMIKVCVFSATQRYFERSSDTSTQHCA